jgi:signal-transduction protein with cAMP-binding, CBS, and nucleotidyltransferase domain
MQTSVIRHRVADFLKQHSPFDALSDPDLLDLAGSGRVKFHESEEFVYWQGDPPGAFLWVVQQGRVDLLEGDTLRDVLGAGDLLGLDRSCSARTASDVILYAVDRARFDALSDRYPAVKAHVHSHFHAPGRTSWLDAEPPTLDFLRRRTHPPAAVRLEGPLTVRNAVRQMVRAGVDALEVEDTVLTAADLALFCGRDPIRLIQEIRAFREPLLGVARRLLLEALASPADVDDYLLLKAALLPDPVPTGDLAAAIRDPILNDLYGHRALFDHVFDLEVPENVIGILANDTMDNMPPLTFYDGAVLDLDGGRRATLDLESSALNPIVDAARVFALARRSLDPPGVLERLALAGSGAVFQEAADAYRVAFYYHTIGGRLSRYDQRLLKTAFVAIQRLLELTNRTFVS